MLETARGFKAATRESPPCQESIEKVFPLLKNRPRVIFERGASEKEPHRLQVAVLFSGGQAPGGHDAVAGLYRALKELHPESRLFGFLGGVRGLMKADSMELTEELVAGYRGEGGFDLLGSGRDKVETEEDLSSSLQAVSELDLDGLVIIGGDDSNTNAAFLAEYFLRQGHRCRVVGLPKTIDGDLKNDLIETSFGFDTACKTFSHTIGALARDAKSAKKYYFFIKLMGRSASHIALECALQTHPNYTLIGEEIASKKKSLKGVVNGIADLVCYRAERGKSYGVILIPEGIAEFIPEMKSLIEELNRALASGLSDPPSALSKEAAELFESLPEAFRFQLLAERDPHGNVQLSKIESERLLLSLVKEALARRKARGGYRGSFSAQPLFLGYEGRSCKPSFFDSAYSSRLGLAAALLIDRGFTGYMAAVRGLAKPPEEWTLEGVPLVPLMSMQERKGRMAPAIRKTLVDLKGGPFLRFESQRGAWSLEDAYLYPLPIQFFGPKELVEKRSETLSLEAACR